MRFSKKIILPRTRLHISRIVLGKALTKVVLRQRCLSGKSPTSPKEIAWVWYKKPSTEVVRELTVDVNLLSMTVHGVLLSR